MDQFIYVLKPTRLDMLNASVPVADEIIELHFKYLEALSKKGVMILVGGTLKGDDSTFSIAVFEAKDEAAARAIMLNDPVVSHGVMSATLYPFRVTLMRK